MKFISFCFKTFSAAVPKFLFVSGLALALASCQWGDQIEAIIQPNPDAFTALFSDTSSVNLSSVATDSFMTGSSSRILFGRFTDPYLGRMHAAGFIQPGFPQGGISIPETAIYDSLVLSLRYDGYYYGDTTVSMNMNIHALQADMMLKNAYYNDDSTPYDPAPIGKISFRPNPRPKAGSASDPTFGRAYLQIKLSNDLGKKIFDNGKANKITNSGEWINLLKGLALLPGSLDNGSAVGFITGSTSLRLHYHVPDVVEGVSRDSTTFNLAGIYNQTGADRSKTVLSKLPATHRISLPSSQSGEMSFIQEGSGIMTRVDLPTIRQLKDVRYSYANRAYLRITPLKRSALEPFGAPATLYAYLVDKNNEYYSNGNGLPLALEDLGQGPVSSPLYNDLVNDRQYYLLDLSQYVSNILSIESADLPGLLLRSSTFSNNPSLPELNTQFSKGFHRLVIGSQNNPTDRGVKLEVYYTTAKAK